MEGEDTGWKDTRQTEGRSGRIREINGLTYIKIRYLTSKQVCSLISRIGWTRRTFGFGFNPTKQ